LIGFTDASWCSDVDDRRSTVGYMFFINNAPISWCSKKEQVVALSSCEAGYIAASMCATQATWLKTLIEEVTGVSSVELRYHYLRDQVTKGLLKLEHCRSEIQVVDVLTKSVQVEVFKRLRDMMGVVALIEMN
jgi:hypothetical protein